MRARARGLATGNHSQYSSVPSREENFAVSAGSIGPGAEEDVSAGALAMGAIYNTVALNKRRRVVCNRRDAGHVIESGVMNRLVAQCRPRLRILRYTLIFAALLCAIWSGREAAADERKVYLNGIDLADVDVRGHSFKGCEVRFDKQGNVHITVKGLQIGTSDGETDSKRKDKKLGNKYFLVVKPVTKRGERYQLSVYINGKLAKLVKGTPQMQVHDVTRLVKKGDNTVRLVSAKSMSGKSKSRPTQDLQIVVGRGVIENGTVLIQVPHVEYRRRASATKRYDKSHKFTTE